jgi:pimeloyl-ACP methyl ester carboxylesterase
MTSITDPSGIASEAISVFTSAQGEARIMAAYQRLMDAWPVPFEDLTVGTTFGDTHVIASGPPDAPPVVFLHALFATATSWHRNVEITGKSYRTYCVDVIGEANKSRPIQPIASMDDFLQWFTELIDVLGIDTLYLAGNSYGGFTAAYYAMKLPDRVRKLVLVGPASTIHAMRPFMLHMFVPKGLYQAVPGLPGLDRVVRSSVNWIHAGLPADPLWEPLFLETMKHGKLINRVFPRVYTREELGEIKAPVLLLMGDREIIYGDLRAALSAAEEVMPEADVVVVPDAHHFSALARPDIVNRELLRFFGDSGPAAND